MPSLILRPFPRLAAAALVLAATAAQAQINLGQITSNESDPSAGCTPLGVESMRLMQQVSDTESLEARLQRRIGDLRRALATIARLAPQDLPGRIAATEALVADLAARPPQEGVQGARQGETKLVAEATLEMLRAAQAGTSAAEPARRRIAEAEGLRATAAANLAALRPVSADALRRSQACYQGLRGPDQPFVPPPIPAGIADLRGKWESQREPGGAWRPTEIGQIDTMLTLVDEYGDFQAAKVEGDTVAADAWLDAITGQVSADRRSIRFENGMVWRRR